MKSQEQSKTETATGITKEPQTGNNIKIPEGKFAVWERIGSLETEDGPIQFFAGQSDKYHVDLSFAYGNDRKEVLIQSKINFNPETGHHEFIFDHPDEELFEGLEVQQGFGQIFTNYSIFLNQKEEQFLQTLDRESHVHRIYTHRLKINGKEKDIELIHQTLGGDCVLANLINTTSLESVEGNISLTIKEARDLAIRLRNERGAATSDILLSNAPLENADAFYLFYNKLGSRPPRQSDLMNIDGNLPENQLEEKAMEVVERILGCSRHVCSVGMQIHSTSIKWIPGGTPKEFIVIDPLKREGLQFFDVDEIVTYIKNGIRGHHSDNNFFCFID